MFSFCAACFACGAGSTNRNQRPYCDTTCKFTNTRTGTEFDLSALGAKAVTVGEYTVNVCVPQKCARTGTAAGAETEFSHVCHNPTGNKFGTSVRRIIDKNIISSSDCNYNSVTNIMRWRSKKKARREKKKKKKKEKQRTRAHAHKSAYTSTCTQVRVYKHTHTSPRIQARAHKSAYTSTCTQVRIYKHVHTSPRIQARAHKFTY